GTGQGLSMAHQTIVELHGGGLDFETTPGEGTTFIITLPLQTNPALFDEEEPVGSDIEAVS
ncbi:MAG: ATP-binding protein, partial [Gammaproteobacteria bacterium]